MDILFALQIIFIAALIKESLIGKYRILARVSTISCIGALVLSQFGMETQLIPYTLFVIWMHKLTIKYLNRKKKYIFQ
jgi:hypothetical protein